MGFECFAKRHPLRRSKHATNMLFEPFCAHRKRLRSLCHHSFIIIDFEDASNIKFCDTFSNSAFNVGVYFCWIDALCYMLHFMNYFINIIGIKANFLQLPI